MIIEKGEKMSIYNNYRPALSSEINMTPLIYVMLVLLIVFMVTLPVLNNAVKVDLPKTSGSADISEETKVDVSIDSHGQIYWDNKLISLPVLRTHLQEASVKNPQPEIALKSDRAVRYESVADFLAEAQSYGLNKINFVTSAQPVEK
ncbi:MULTISPECIES: biopolymer transporter ExbD [unclassified Brenneria]|uniref:ExbD/TolR family protein n=1 Tax=unclassified Brenneria TaxID=2634434 RepID=UPI0029C1DADB|nr:MULTISPECIES: biopolymer transporter ExbD [unclassified Brenneria]MDX5630849.1 biopolymer transporter ExbD [Brenneria sp. L3-3Z]MDX5697931.1 biopolymer transporter ExbD [Brenneria sp. L4-2C]